MDVIRHHDPSAQIVTLAVEEPYRILDKFCDFRLAQMTLAAAFVEIQFQLRPALLVVLNLPEMFPFGTKRFWKTVSEAKRDKLREAWLIAMRQITALIPTAKALSGDFRLWL